MMDDDGSGSPLFAELETTDLASRIADQVLKAIGDGRLRPGEKVGEARLARELGTSRAPVREALRLLESQGLIVTHPRRVEGRARFEEELRDPRALAQERDHVL